ncbi:anthranilate synthase component 1 [Thermoanaerobacter kivui]|uniref:aminodeoxychorismate synthase n=1 Tax=Thermoanaerobacter kivui TaxID=2325 RepID=A0A097ATG8_THEKI|nr:aminodeoxychorismate synthase component I [Thermoanaerobacter kivui]AIS53107.1 anthranilate synthase component 1 [Thermoanaerobacter kivui]
MIDKMVIMDKLIEPFRVFYNLNKDYSVLLESNLLDDRFGRYSFVFVNPKEIFLCHDQDDVFEFLDVLTRRMVERRSPSPFIFNGGFAGYLSYNFGVDLFGVERKRDFSATYKAFFGYYEDYIIFDHFDKKTYVCLSERDDLEKIYELENEDNFDGFRIVPPVVNEVVCNFEKEEYKQSICKIREYIYEGDVYQVNLSQQFKFIGKFDPMFLYSILRKRNYGAYHAFVKLDKSNIVSTSPELFLQKRDDVIITRPIKGTVRRGKDHKEDEYLKNLLYNDEKCRSELLMIVDLERNDFAKICKPYSICVEKLFEVEEYSTVFHLVSTIKGELNRGIDFGDIIRATFPGGSITGAPKLNSIKIIEELEKTPRGVYTGSIGYVSNNFNMDFNIAIRTMIIEGNQAYYNVGGGIVWDSNEEEEYKETLYKGKPLYDILTNNQNSIKI